MSGRISASKARPRFCAEGDLPANEVSELLRTIELEYGIPAGLLRPSDPLDHLTAPVPVRNPLRDAFYRFWIDEHWGEISYELESGSIAVDN